MLSISATLSGSVFRKHSRPRLFLRKPSARIRHIAMFGTETDFKEQKNDVAMGKTYADIIYHEIKIRGLVRLFKPGASQIENKGTLDDILNEMNVTKCSIKDVEMESPGSALYLTYLLQKDKGINFGICEFFKMWNKESGWQYGCKMDQGRGSRIQVNCHARVHRCERKQQVQDYMCRQNLSEGAGLDAQTPISGNQSCQTNGTDYRG